MSIRYINKLFKDIKNSITILRLQTRLRMFNLERFRCFLMEDTS